MKKSLLKPVFMSLVVLFTAVAITPSIEKITEASYNQTEDTDDLGKNVLEISRDQMQDMSRNPFKPLVLTKEQTEKLYNDGVFNKEDVERERQLRNSLEEEKNNCNSLDLESSEKSGTDSNCSSKAKYFIIFPNKGQKNIE